MILREIKHNGFKYKQIYFSNCSNQIKNIIDFDILRLYQSQNKCKNTNAFYTLFTDLTKNIDEIKMCFGKTIRQEINRSIKENNIEIEIIKNPSDAEIEELIREYIIFKNFKQLATDTNYMKKSFAVLSDNLVFFKVKYQNNYIIYNSYIVDNDRAKLKTSTSSRYTNNRDVVNLISRSNKRVHLEAIQYFKNDGRSIYDWGGVSKDMKGGVDKFKKSFGGILVEEYEGIIFRNKFIKFKYLLKTLGFIELIKKIIKKIANVKFF